GEVHSFSSMAGEIGESGEASVVIDLDSVETLIPIRNERMREMLFKTADFPKASVSAQVEPAVLQAASEEGVTQVELPLRVSLHGAEANLNASFTVVGEGDGRIRVFSARPLLVNAASFGLEPGIEALREVAGLSAISTSVPVTLQLVFVPSTE
ncbi:MAG: YceI family protein, partial [Halioglobus sp.]